MLKFTKFSIILIVGGFLLFISCTKEKMLPIPKSIQTNISLLPQDALGIGYVNVTSIKNSPFFEEFMRSWEKDTFYSEDLEAVFNETGFDIRKDIEEVFFSISKENIGFKSPQGIIIASGNFNSEAIVEYLKKQKNQEFEEVIYKNFSLFRLGDNKLVACFPTNNKLIAGQEDAIKFSLDNLQNTTKIDDKLLGNLKKLKYINGAWVIIDAQPVIKQLSSEFKNDGNINQIRGLQSVQNMNFSFIFDNKIHFNSRGNFSNTEDSQLFFDAFKGLIATVKLSQSKDRTAIDVLNKVKVNNRGTEIELDVTFTKDDIEKLKLSGEKLTNL